MKTIVAATILKCAVCGVTMEMEPKKYLAPDGNEPHQLASVITIASQEYQKVMVHHCDLDRVWGIRVFAGVKHYRTLEEE